MKWTHLLWVPLAVGVLACKPSASAVPAHDVRVDWSPWHAGEGGEFSVQPGGGLSYLLHNYSPLTKGQDTGNGYPNNFQTFCVQEHVFFSPGDTMQGSLSDHRMPDGQALPQGVAWLYNQFALGTLSDYDYANAATPYFASRNGSAAALQNTIWWLFGDGSDPGSGNVFRNQVMNYSALHSPVGNSMLWALAANDVQVIPVEVLVTQYDPALGGWGDGFVQNGYRQNFLARVPEAGSTLGMLALGIGSLMLMRGKINYRIIGSTERHTEETIRLDRLH